MLKDDQGDKANGTSLRAPVQLETHRRATPLFAGAYFQGGEGGGGCYYPCRVRESAYGRLVEATQQWGFSFPPGFSNESLIPSSRWKVREFIFRVIKLLDLST